VQMR